MEQSSTTNLLPSLNMSAIAHSITSRNINTEILAQLLFLPGQYLLVYAEDDRTSYKLLSPEGLREAFVGEPIDSGWLPPNTVKWGKCYKGEWLVQFYPPQRYRLLLSNFNANTTITVAMPALVFMGCGCKYWLWAVKGKQFNYNDQLFHAPLPNIMEDGSICFGDTSPVPCSPIGIMKSWELFWTSVFNEHMVQRKSKSYPLDVRSHLQKLHHNNSKKYPSRDLVPINNKSIADAIEHILA
ncbi:prokaryotic E2 ligase family D protein [Aetokthonos hydrillicola Thurmond2011]|jgi:PRTRC genetic system protein B|uniref:Prokaryotic E2 ligase family D protein n=1 Tax=Aetokthonos hydrillicola Thurmond2011 TaxID=2712845 RepID=A0AAP5IAC8_9CYAN|nr:hypothetical protein [Aetokthonos hydrillicola]MBO3458447.1 hypothetical protein [Aetokthonos hydrillicola CCALA 1050]MBW4586226.1 prokaryotic E2 ligase family D protein [Aetokthonos hydrillicola CCALA 1050]MDR9897833.1 prokaryotic E2 ligase family D protein [Aetokthonos hydrillicola Thurmond2011]